jgi:hypothetical protein
MFQTRLLFLIQTLILIEKIRWNKKMKAKLGPCHDNSSDTQAYFDSARYCKLKVSGL